MSKKTKNFKQFENTDNSDNPLKTIKDFLESFIEYEIDWIETVIDDFAHEFPMEDFYPYIIVDDNIKIEKESLLSI